MRRVKTRLMGVAKYVEFSWKNGRFSGKRTSNLWLTVICGSSDSTCPKSGLMVASRTKLSLITALASRPALAWMGLESKVGCEGSRWSRLRNERTETKGINWKLRPGEIFSRPAREPSWVSRPCTFMEYLGKNECSLLLCGMSRSRRMPQSCTSVVDLKRSDLKGTEM